MGAKARTDRRRHGRKSSRLAQQQLRRSRQGSWRKETENVYAVVPRSFLTNYCLQPDEGIQGFALHF
jgi:hypothetical protein